MILCGWFSLVHILLFLLTHGFGKEPYITIVCVVNDYRSSYVVHTSSWQFIIVLIQMSSPGRSWVNKKWWIHIRVKVLRNVVMISHQWFSEMLTSIKVWWATSMIAIWFWKETLSCLSACVYSTLLLYEQSTRAKI